MARLDAALKDNPATRVLDAAWRAGAYCLHPRVIGWSLLPLVLAIVLGVGALWLVWEPAVTGVRAQMESWLLVDALLKLLDTLGLSSFRAVVAPLIVMMLAAPLFMALSLLLVATLMTPALTRLVGERRFPHLAQRQGGSFWGSLLASLGATAIALLAMALTLPLWFVPPLALLLPPLIWGWLSYRVFSYDVLAAHASADERRELIRRHRGPLLAIGVASGYLGAAPALVFTFGALNVILAPLLLPVAIWLYTLVFAFAALWFAHYALAALQRQRDQALTVDVDATPLPTPPAEPPCPSV
jgi:hypothetical protein